MKNPEQREEFVAQTIDVLRRKYRTLDEVELKRRAEMLIRGVAVPLDGRVLDLDAIFNEAKVEGDSGDAQ